MIFWNKRTLDRAHANQRLNGLATNVNRDVSDFIKLGLPWHEHRDQRIPSALSKPGIVSLSIAWFLEQISIKCEERKFHLRCLKSHVSFEKVSNIVLDESLEFETITERFLLLEALQALFTYVLKLKIKSNQIKVSLMISSNKGIFYGH